MWVGQNALLLCLRLDNLLQKLNAMEMKICHLKVNLEVKTEYENEPILQITAISEKEHASMYQSTFKPTFSKISNPVK